MPQNKQLYKNIITKHEIIQACRNVLGKYEFVEVNTPAIRKASNKVFGRRKVIIDEKYTDTKEGFLKHSHDTVLRTLLRYCDNIFELGPCYRLDPPDETHYPEFMLLELAATHKPFDFFISIAKEIVSASLKKELNYQFISVKKFISDDLGIEIDLLSDDELKDKVIKSNAAYNDFTNKPAFHVLNRYISDRIENIPGINFLTEYPVCTISKAKRIENTNAIYRFELFIDGLEVAHSYLYEDNLPDFKLRTAINELTHSEVQKTIAMMENGEFPELSGILGIGIERLCCASTKQPISDFIAANDFNFI